MSLLLDNQFKELPPDKSVDTKTFLDNVSSLPSFFGESMNATHQPGDQKDKLQTWQTGFSSFF